MLSFDVNLNLQGIYGPSQASLVIRTVRCMDAQWEHFFARGEGASRPSAKTTWCMRAWVVKRELCLQFGYAGWPFFLTAYAPSCRDSSPLQQLMFGFQLGIVSATRITVILYWGVVFSLWPHTQLSALYCTSFLILRLLLVSPSRLFLNITNLQDKLYNHHKSSHFFI